MRVIASATLLFTTFALMAPLQANPTATGPSDNDVARITRPNRPPTRPPVAREAQPNVQLIGGDKVRREPQVVIDPCGPDSNWNPECKRNIGRDAQVNVESNDNDVVRLTRPNRCPPGGRGCKAVHSDSDGIDVTRITRPNRPPTRPPVTL